MPRSRSLTDRGLSLAASASSSCVSPAPARNRRSSPPKPDAVCSATGPSPPHHPSAARTLTRGRPQRTPRQHNPVGFLWASTCGHRPRLPRPWNQPPPDPAQAAQTGQRHVHPPRQRRQARPRPAPRHARRHRPTPPGPPAPRPGQRSPAHPGQSRTACAAPGTRSCGCAPTPDSTTGPNRPQLEHPTTRRASHCADPAIQAPGRRRRPKRHCICRRAGATAEGRPPCATAVAASPRRTCTGSASWPGHAPRPALVRAAAPRRTCQSATAVVVSHAASRALGSAS